MDRTDPFAAFPERSTVIARGFSPFIDRAVLLGSLVAGSIALVLGFAVGVVLPPLLGPFLGAAVGAVVAIVVVWVATPGTIRRAFGAYSWLGRGEVRRFEARTGGPVPTAPEDIERWLVAHPSTPATVLPRIEMLAFVGRFEEARAELDAADPGVTPDERFERASLRQYIGWLETGDPGLEALQAAADAIPAGTIERRMADVNVALGEARILGMAGDPGWFGPLERARAGLGWAPDRVVLRDTGSRLAVVYVLVAVVATIAVGLLGFLIAIA